MLEAVFVRLKSTSVMALVASAILKPASYAGRAVASTSCPCNDARENYLRHTFRFPLSLQAGACKRA